MIEHIFRNINDIRIFDIMAEFVVREDKEKSGEIDKEDIADIDEIMDMLDYSEYKRLEVEDSVDHLVRNDILGIKKTGVEGSTGCKICKWTDKLGLPRMGEHVTHKPEEVSVGYIENYYMKDIELTRSLRSAVFQHVMAMVEKDKGEEKKGEEKKGEEKKGEEKKGEEKKGEEKKGEEKKGEEKKGEDV